MEHDAKRVDEAQRVAGELNALLDLNFLNFALMGARIQAAPVDVVAGVVVRLAQSGGARMPGVHEVACHEALVAAVRSGLSLSAAVSLARRGAAREAFAWLCHTHGVAASGAGHE